MRPAPGGRWLTLKEAAAEAKKLMNGWWARHATFDKSKMDRSERTTRWGLDVGSFGKKDLEVGDALQVVGDYMLTLPRLLL